MQLLTEGTWWLHSPSDPRWNTSGVAHVGAFTMPAVAQQWIDKLKATLGEPPADLEWGYEKD